MEIHTLSMSLSVALKLPAIFANAWSKGDAGNGDKDPEIVGRGRNSDDLD